MKNLALNFGFSILHNNPNIFLYDLKSPAGSSIRFSYGLPNLNFIFDNRYIKTYTIDNNELYNNININYNKYVLENSQTKVVSVKCGKTVSEYIKLKPILQTHRPFGDLMEIWYYIQLRNKEEGRPIISSEIDEVYKKAKYFYKKT